MSITKPFHRNYRPVLKGPNSGYSDWAYIVHPNYAEKPEFYVRAFSIIQDDVQKLFEFVEPSDVNSDTYSFRIHELLIRICIEVEANFKAILRENNFTPLYKNGKKASQPRLEKDWNINDYRKVNKTHHLDDYSVIVPFWKGEKSKRKPFSQWKASDNLSWYDAYNQSKHDRVNNFHLATLDNLIDAYTGLFVLLTAQFKNQSFSPGKTSVLSFNIDSYHKVDTGIGGFLMVEFPSDWDEEEQYDFDWSTLKLEQEQFQKLDYNK